MLFAMHHSPVHIGSLPLGDRSQSLDGRTKDPLSQRAGMYTNFSPGGIYVFGVCCAAVLISQHSRGANVGSLQPSIAGVCELNCPSTQAFLSLALTGKECDCLDLQFTVLYDSQITELYDTQITEAQDHQQLTATCGSLV